ncbi:MAG: hypothetical protein HQL71_13515 [Magnetococcales bacterium]|nr:hypothetical protein [Magnetococcales bacterium]
MADRLQTSMNSVKQKKFPLFLLVDDCAFPRINGDTGELIPFSAYETLLRLAEAFDICIPLCFTMRYLDLEGRWSGSTPIPYAKQLVELVKNNPQHLLFCDHGLTHKLGNTNYEFFNPDTGEHLNEQEHRKLLKIIIQIWDDLDLDFPEIMVPPSNSWVPNLTDRIYAEAGCRYIVSISHSKNQLLSRDLFSPGGIKKVFTPKFKWPDHSPHLTLLPRRSWLLSCNRINPSGWLLQQMMRSLAQPCSGPFAALYNRTSLPLPVHSYMTHIGNFVGDHAFDFWYKLFHWADAHPSISLARSFDDARLLYDDLAPKKEVLFDHDHLD